MTLYEEYQNGLNPVVYGMKAYNNLLRAILITIEEDNFYDERDTKILWDMITHIGNLNFITDKYSRDLLKDFFSTFGDFIDSRLLAMVRDYENMSISDYLKLYCGKVENDSVYDDSRVVKEESGDNEILDCISSTGLRRSNNEDFACSITSKINDDFKLLIVCDGVGGSVQGEMASEIVTKEFIKWFRSYEFRCGFDGIILEVSDIINRAREVIKEKCNMAATTLTCAIIGPDKTFVLNIGDSRAYTIKDNDLTQITSDDSEVWADFYKCGLVTKDELRFLPGNNVITKAIDFFPVKNMQTYFVDNTDYDGILLMSDGVTDILSDDMLKRIVHDNKQDDILKGIIYESCFGDPSYPPENSDEVLYPTLPGKDNASAAMYLKLRK